jgi:DNA modification methylase
MPSEAKVKKPRKSKSKSKAVEVDVPASIPVENGTKVLAQHITEDYSVYLGDNSEVIAGIPDNSIGFMLTSVPFPGMYVYNNTPRDVGNVKDNAEMVEHFRHLAGPDGLYRVLMPGRTFCVHLTQTSLLKHKDGVVGRMDFRGDVIRMMQVLGWVYVTEIAIDKDPQLQAIRSRDRGLLFKSLANDSSHLAPVRLDYLLCFRKPGDNPVPIRAGVSSKYKNPDGWITEEEWIEWAHGVWHRWDPVRKRGIRETDVLNVACARDQDDEKHLCPLQLGVIERAVKLWSAPGEIVLDPFSGVGSTGFRAIQLMRRYIGIELKESYYRQSIRYLDRAVATKGADLTLFDSIEEDTPDGDS